jgi:hypothetical protein
MNFAGDCLKSAPALARPVEMATRLAWPANIGA